MSVDDAKTAEAAVGSRPCLACGYDLQGLGEEPRCPECGLLNIPEGYRRQVQELVDSDKWFFSSFFGVLRKRPPGWWWSLDRPGDVRRAVIRAAVYVGAMLLVTLVGAAAASIVRQAGHEESDEKVWEHSQDASINHVRVRVVDWTEGIGGDSFDLKESYRLDPFPASAARSPLRITRRSFLGSPREFESTAIIFSIFLLSFWLIPAAAGIWTQIRKGLPSYARPRRSIFAASLYEAHRLVFLSVIACGGLLLDALFRYYDTTVAINWTILHIALLLLGLFAALGWLGPVRSDSTHQLIQTRWQAARIIVLYVPLLLWFLMLAIAVQKYSLL